MKNVKIGTVVKLKQDINEVVHKGTEGVVANISEDKINIMFNCGVLVVNNKEFNDMLEIISKDEEVVKENEIKINGVAYVCCDVSSSVNNQKIKFYKEIYKHYKTIYKEVKLIAFNTEAILIKESEICDVCLGGTYISSGVDFAIKELMQKEYSKSDSIIICGDGDNWSEDNERAINLIRFASNIWNVEYFEIFPSSYTATFYTKLTPISKNLKRYQIKNENCDIFGNKLKECKQTLSIIINGVKNTEKGILKVFNEELSSLDISEITPSLLKSIINNIGGDINNKIIGSNSYHFECLYNGKTFYFTGNAWKGTCGVIKCK